MLFHKSSFQPFPNPFGCGKAVVSSKIEIDVYRLLFINRSYIYHTTEIDFCQEQKHDKGVKRSENGLKTVFFLQSISIHISSFAANNNDRAAKIARSMK
jgi:hypothetical protein